MQPVQTTTDEHKLLLQSDFDIDDNDGKMTANYGSASYYICM